MHNWTGLEPFGAGIEPQTLKRTPRCRHCGNPYAAVDEHPDTLYAGLCPACVEAAKAERRQRRATLAARLTLGSHAENRRTADDQDRIDGDYLARRAYYGA